VFPYDTGRAKAGLLAHLPAVPVGAGPFTLTANYEATSPEAAARLAAWWRAQQGSTVTVEVLEPTDPTELQALLEEHLASDPEHDLWVSTREDRAWRVGVESPRYTQVTPPIVEQWFALLAEAPQDRAWRLQGTGLCQAGPWAAPE
jgi:hypothetical protein